VTSDNGTRMHDLDALVEQEMARLQIPGMTVGILHDGEVKTYGYGVISLATHYPTRPDTLFQIGSNTKVFTATLAMRLVEQGKLDLDTPVRAYLPDLRLADEQVLATITPRHLFTHLSGLEGDRFEDFGPGDDALARGIAQAYTWAQERDPGELWSYCNSGFYLAGRVLEQVLETPYEAAMAEHLFKPLGLEHTFWFAHEAIMYSAAAGHTQLPGQEEPQVAHPYQIPRACNPAGAIISNVADLLAFLAFHMGDGAVNGERILSRAALEAMRQPQARVNGETEWGIGWSLRTVDATRVVQHGGGTNGHITQMLMVPEKRFGLAVLTNSGRGGGAIRAVERWAFERYCGLAARDPEPIEVPAAEIEPLAGRYDQTMGRLEIVARDGNLFATPTINNPFSGEENTLPEVQLAPLGAGEFVAIGGEMEGMRSEFIPGDDGHPRFVRFGGRLARRAN
jgi:CubicO group peptidase (beta-lactamase class C family)